MIWMLVAWAQEPGETPTATQEPTHTSRDALVVALSGAGTVSLAGDERPLQLWDTLDQGSRVCTAPDAFATVRLAVDLDDVDHDDISLLPGTCLTVVSAVASAEGRESRVVMDEGSVSVRSVDEAPGTVVVETADSVTTGEQGGFRVTVEDGASRTEAVTAPVTVEAEGVTVDVAPRQGTRVENGTAPQDPVELLRMALPIAPADGATLRHPDFSWSPVGRALGYRVQVSTRPDFSRVVQQQDVPATVWQPDFLMLPSSAVGVWWRVSSFDRFGFEGPPSEPRQLLLPPAVLP